MEIQEYKVKKILEERTIYDIKFSNLKKKYDNDIRLTKNNFLMPLYQRTFNLKKIENDFRVKSEDIKKEFNNKISEINNLKAQKIPCNGNKKALLIGINYTNTQAQLNGCINDVQLVESYLKKEGFSDITFVTDKTPIKPTRNNILSNLSKFLETSNENEILYFHYSGHGSYVLDSNNDEIDKKDETIVSSDFYHIKDDEIIDVIKRKLKPKNTLIAFFDSCHSGTILDLKYTFTENIEKMTINETHQYNDLLSNVIMVSGCRDSQYSQETLTSTGINGLMTWALCQVLSSRSDSSWKQLYVDIRKKLRDIKAEQIPQLSMGSLIDINDKCIF